MVVIVPEIIRAIGRPKLPLCPLRNQIALRDGCRREEERVETLMIAILANTKLKDLLICGERVF